MQAPRLGGSWPTAYSFDQFIEELPAQPDIVAIAGETVHSGVYFLEEHPLTALSGEALDDFLGRVDLTLYAARKTGRNRVVRAPS